MNKHYILSLLDPTIGTVGVKFRGGDQTYTYKTREKLAVGDACIVDTPSNGLQVVTVAAVHNVPQLEPDSKIDYKWVIQRVNREAYDALLTQEKEQLSRVQEAEREAHRQSARAALLQTLPALANLTPTEAPNGYTALENGLLMDRHGAPYHPSFDGRAAVGPFDSVREAMAAWDRAKQSGFDLRS